MKEKVRCATVFCVKSLRLRRINCGTLEGRRTEDEAFPMFSTDALRPGERALRVDFTNVRSPLCARRRVQVIIWGSQDWLAIWGRHCVMTRGPVGVWLSRHRPLTMCCRAGPLGFHFWEREKKKTWIYLSFLSFFQTSSFLMINDGSCSTHGPSQTWITETRRMVDLLDSECESHRTASCQQPDETLCFHWEVKEWARLLKYSTVKDTFGGPNTLILFCSFTPLHSKDNHLFFFTVWVTLQMKALIGKCYLHINISVKIQ